MSLSYLQPVEASFTLDDYKPQQVGFQIQKHLYSIGLPDLSDVKIAFFCVEKTVNLLVIFADIFTLYS